MSAIRDRVESEPRAPRSAGSAPALPGELAGKRARPLPSGVYGVWKRGLDAAIASVLLVLLLPLLALIALAVRLDSPGPVLFRQRRIGRWSAEFSIVKFRTMKTGTPDLASHLLGPGSSHVTRVGRLLRRASLDELPNLWNILSGEMALVGPRPALYNQYELIGMRRETGVDGLRPGVTGWAQIHGRDDIPLQEKVAYDRYYRERCSLAFDLWILARTAVTLFSSRGVY